MSNDTAIMIAFLMLLVGAPMLVFSVAVWWRGVQSERRWLARIEQEQQERITQKASGSDGSFCDGC